MSAALSAAADLGSGENGRAATGGAEQRRAYGAADAGVAAYPMYQQQSDEDGGGQGTRRRELAVLRGAVCGREPVRSRAGSDRDVRDGGDGDLARVAARVPGAGCRETGEDDQAEAESSGGQAGAATSARHHAHPTSSVIGEDARAGGSVPRQPFCERLTSAFPVSISTVARPRAATRSSSSQRIAPVPTETSVPVTGPVRPASAR
ncbi:MAG: hypothetical protein QOE05_3195 [Actinomycetota bacterium]|nr:hypothetical protein [Actinomycetota bacterium]